MFIHRPFGPYVGGFADHGVRVVALFIMVALWVVVALLIAALVHAYRHGRHGVAHANGAGPEKSPSSPAVDILRERFARGEISEEEFTRRLTVLKGS